MSEKSQTKFQIRYLKSYLKHMAYVARENKIIFNVTTRLTTEYNSIYRLTKNLPLLKDSSEAEKAERVNALKMMQAIDTQIKSLYKPFDIDERFCWRGKLFKTFGMHVYYEVDGKKRVHTISEDSKITGAHILYNRLRGRPSHLKDDKKENEYIHELTYWTQRLAFLYEEECARNLIPKDFIRKRDAVGECGDGVVRTNAHREGAESHG